VLRQEELAEASPPPTDLAGLVEEARAAGTRIDVVDGTLGSLDGLDGLGPGGGDGVGDHGTDGDGSPVALGLGGAGDGDRPLDGLGGDGGDGVLPPDLARHVYRIVQEGLTNARKHAPGAPVRLSVCGRPGDGVSIEITNPVRNAAGASIASAGGAIPGAGVGLVGVRERVELLGGTLERSIDDPGTHRLRVWMPWPA
jgi:hypothetical protein